MGRHERPVDHVQRPGGDPAHEEEAGIDKTIIFPIENSTYRKANEEIAQIVARYPGKFVGFAKHDPVGEAGKIEQLHR